MLWTRVAQPTAQNGQTLGVTLALATRSSCARATTGARLTPDATNPPSAVAPPPAMRKTSRREIFMDVLLPERRSTPTQPSRRSGHGRAAETQPYTSIVIVRIS